MRDARGQLANGLHPLRVAEPFFGRFTIADVDRQHAQPRRDGLQAELEMPHAAVRKRERVLQHLGRPRGERALHRGVERRRLDPGIALGHEAPDQLFLGPPAVAGGGVVEVEVPQLGVEHLEPLEHRVEHRREIRGGEGHTTSQRGRAATVNVRMNSHLRGAAVEGNDIGGFV